MIKFIVKMITQTEHVWATREVGTEEEIPDAIRQIVDEIQIFAPGDSIHIEEID